MVWSYNLPVMSEHTYRVMSTMKLSSSCARTHIVGMSWLLVFDYALSNMRIGFRVAQGYQREIRRSLLL